MQVLVAYGTKMGGTEGIAQRIGAELADQGLDVDVLPAGDVRSVDGYDTAEIGSGLYAGHWRPSARHLVKREAKALRRRPVWFFDSGPLDNSATNTDLPAVPQVKRLMDRVHARGHRTFGGWAREIASDLEASVPTER